MKALIKITPVLALMICTSVQTTWAQQSTQRKQQPQQQAQKQQADECDGSMSQSGTATLHCRGGIAGGGGTSDKATNTTIDTYARRVDQIRGYNEVVKPVLDRLALRLPELHKQLMLRVKIGGFYLIPNKILITLPVYKTGIPFDVNLLEQTAFNLNNEVWIDDTKFSKKDVIDAGNLLLHEIFMLDLIAAEKYKDWPSLHSAVRRVGSYLRLNPDDDETTLQQVMLEIYKKRFAVKTVYDREINQTDKAKIVYTEFITGFKNDIAGYCSKLPNYYEFKRLSAAEKTAIQGDATALFNFVYDRTSYVVDSGNFDNIKFCGPYPGYPQQEMCSEIKEIIANELYNKRMLFEGSYDRFPMSGLVRRDIKSNTINFFYENGHHYDHYEKFYAKMITICKDLNMEPKLRAH